MGLFSDLLGGSSAASLASSVTGVQPADTSFTSKLGGYLDRMKIGMGYGPVAATIGGNRSGDMDALIKGMIQKYNTQGGIGGVGGSGGGGSCPGGVCKVEGIQTNATPMSGTGSPYTQGQVYSYRSPVGDRFDFTRGKGGIASEMMGY